MISSIRFKNYKIFANEQELLLAPITIIFGRNNVGKSALLKLPLFVDALLRNKLSNELFPIKVNGVEFCEEYRDIIYNKGNNALELTIKSDTNSQFYISFYVDNSTVNKTQVENWSLYNSKGDLVSNMDNDVAQIDELRPEHDSKYDWYNKLSGCYNDFIQNVEYMHCIRTIPARDLRINDEIGIIGYNGKCAYNQILKDVVTGKKDLLNKVSAWYEKNFDGWRLEIDQQRAPVYSINLCRNGFKTNILDTGSGIIQSMPIVVAANIETVEDTLFVIEEPETHLHPSAHASLSEELALSVINQNKRFLIETHSFNFILRLQSLIANGTLKPSQVAIYYVDADSEEKSSNLKRVEINDDGSVNNWPRDYFNDSFKEVLKLRTIQNRINNENIN